MLQRNIFPPPSKMSGVTFHQFEINCFAVTIRFLGVPGSKKLAFLCTKWFIQTLSDAILLKHQQCSIKNKRLSECYLQVTNTYATLATQRSAKLNRSYRASFWRLLGLISGNLIFRELNFSRLIFRTNWQTFNILLVFGVGLTKEYYTGRAKGHGPRAISNHYALVSPFGVLEFPCKFGASIIKGLILSFKVKVISDAVSSAT